MIYIVNHQPTQVYNCDETGLNVLQHKTKQSLLNKSNRKAKESDMPEEYFRKKEVV